MSLRHLLLLTVVFAACDRAPRGSLPSSRATDTTLRAPDGSTIPADELGRSILRGHAILTATRDSLPAHVGNALRCTSCHLGDGRERQALPLIGAYGRFPQFRWRAASVQRVEDRINDCFLRSMNGTALAWDDPAMRDIVVYLAFLSRGVAVGDTTTFPLGNVLAGDTVAGARIYARTCARCHGATGNGTVIGVAAFPPLWGPRSFNIGAGMARVRTVATFIQRNMPRDSAGILSATDALNVAAYVTSRPRPDFAGKEHDWPCGHRPPDVPYPTSGSACASVRK